jgi:hypothetical protein
MTNDKDIGERQNALAVELAGLATAELNTAIETVLKAKEDLLSGPFAIIGALEASLGNKVDSLPKPGEKEGNNPAIYKVAVMDKRTGKQTKLETNFYNVYADSLPEGKAVISELRMIVLSRDIEANHTGIPKAIMDMTPQQKNVREGYLTGRKSTNRAKVIAAVELRFQFEAVNSVFGVKAEPFFADDNRTIIDNSTTPIHVFNPKNDKKEWKAVSISSFMKFDAPKAIEKGGTYAALLETIKRKKGEAETEINEAKPHFIKTLDTFKARTADFHQYMDEVWSASDKARYTELLKTMGPRSTAGNGQFKLELYGIYTMLGDLFKHTEIKAHIEALKRADALGQDTA